MHQREQAAAIGLVNRKQNRAFAELDFVAEHEKLVYLQRQRCLERGSNFEADTPGINYLEAEAMPSNEEFGKV